MEGVATTELLMIKKATYRILAKQQQGTGWLCLPDGYILTAGHIITNNVVETLTQKDGETVTVYIHNTPFPGCVVFCVYDPAEYQDFALIKADFESQGIPIKLDLAFGFSHLKANSQVHLYGYGERDREATPSPGTYNGPYSEENRLLSIRCENAVQQGMSGAAVYSHGLERIIGIQTSASDFETGAISKDVLAMPISAILSILDEQLPEISDRLRQESQHSYKKNSDIVKCGTRADLDNAGEVIRGNKIEAIRERFLQGARVVIAHGIDGLGKRRIVQQMIRESVDLFSDYQIVSLNESVNVSSAVEMALYRGIGNKIEFSYEVDQELLLAQTGDLYYELRLHKLSQLDSSMLFVVEFSKDIAQASIEALLKLSCRFILISSEPCDFIKDIDWDCAVVSLAFDPDVDFPQMNQIFEETFTKKAVCQAIGFLTRKSLFEQLDYHTHTIVLLVKALESVEDADSVICEILRGGIVAIENKFSHKSPTRFHTLVEHLKTLIRYHILSDDHEKPLLELLAVLGARRLQYDTLRNHYSVCNDSGFQSLHNNGILSYNSSSGEISINSVIRDLYYVQLYLMEKDRIPEINNRVAQGLINQYSVQNCYTFSDAQNDLEIIVYVISRMANPGSPNQALSIIMESIANESIRMDNRLKLKLLTKLAEYFNALGMMTESNIVLKLVNTQFSDSSLRIQGDTLQCFVQLGKLSHSLGDVDGSIAILENTLEQRDILGDDWKMESNILLSLMDLYTIKKDRKRVAELVESAANLYIANEKPFGAAFVLQKALHSSFLPKRLCSKLINTLFKLLKSKPNNAVELNMLFALKTQKALFPIDMFNEIIDLEYLFDYMMAKNKRIPNFLLIVRLKKFLRRIDENDPASQFLYILLNGADATPEMITQAIYDFFEQMSNKSADIGLSFGFIGAFGAYIEFISNRLKNLFSIDMAFALELLIRRIMNRELPALRRQLSLTNIEVTDERAFVYQFLAQSIGINESLRYLHEYEDDVKAIPESYRLSKAKSLENLGNLYLSVSHKVPTEMHLQYVHNAQNAFKKALKYVPDTRVEMKARLLIKIKKYQDAYYLLCENSMYQCGYCECCYNLALQSLDEDEPKEFKKYLQGILRAWRKSELCGHNKCLPQKLTALIERYRYVQRERDSFYVRLVRAFAGVFDRQKLARTNFKEGDPRSLRKKQYRRSYRGLRFSLSIDSPDTSVCLFHCVKFADPFENKSLKRFVKYIKAESPIEHQFLMILFNQSNIPIGDLKVLCRDTAIERSLSFIDKITGLETLNDVFIQKIINERNLQAYWKPLALIERMLIEIIRFILFRSDAVGLFDRGNRIAVNCRLFKELLKHIAHDANDYIAWLKRAFAKSPKTDLRIITTIVLDRVRALSEDEYQGITMGQGADEIYYRLHSEVVEELFQQKRRAEEQRTLQAQRDHEKMSIQQEVSFTQHQKHIQQHLNRSGATRVYTKKIPDRYFASKPLPGIKVKEEVEVIGSYAFYRCWRLQWLSLGPNVKVMGKEMLSETTIQELTIPRNIIKMAFSLAGATCLRKVVFEDGIESIPEHALASHISSGANSGIEEVALPESVSLIGKGAFHNCITLSAVNLPSSLLFIDASAFESCLSLKSITIPDSVTWIGEEAFKNCTSLSFVELGNNIAHIGRRFIMNTTITSLVIKNDVASMAYAFQGASRLDRVEFAEGCTFVPSYAFAVETGELGFAQIVLPETIESIEDSAFRNCANIKEIPQLDHLLLLRESCFRGCKGLVNVQISERVIEIGSSAFSGCSNLRSISLNHEVRKLGEKFIAFTQITEITIPKTVESMEYALVDANCLVHVTFEEGTNAIPSKALSALHDKRQTLVRQVSLPDTIEKIGFNAFFNCAKLTEILLPSALRIIENAAFEGCGNLSGVTLPAQVETIGDFAFLGCAKLCLISLGSNVEHIGSGFIADTKITDIQIPKSVVSMRHAFKGATSIKRVVFEKGAKIIPAEALCFENSMNVQIHIPESIVSIHPSAFDNTDNLTIYCQKGSYADEFARKSGMAISYDLPVTSVENEL